jgi:D-alanyl-D-alanine dipeptidase
LSEIDPAAGEAPPGEPMPSPTYPRPILTGSFDKRFDLRSFGEPLKRLRSIKVVDIGEPLVDLRDLGSELIFNPGCLPLLRRTVANMVIEVQKSLPEGHRLAIGTCLRTTEMQLGIREHLTEKLRTDHPTWTNATLQRMLNRMVAPVDSVAPAPHTTGGAIDLGIEGPGGQRLKFSPGEDWWPYAPTYSVGLDDESRTHRLMLIRAMESAGLTNYLGDWWHWSYGDQGWSLRVGSPVAYYGAVTVENAESLRIPEPEKPAEADTPAESL